MLSGHKTKSDRDQHFILWVQQNSLIFPPDLSDFTKISEYFPEVKTRIPEHKTHKTNLYSCSELLMVITVAKLTGFVVSDLTVPSPIVPKDQQLQNYCLPTSHLSYYLK